MSWRVGEADKSKLIALLNRMPIHVNVRTDRDGSEVIWVRENTRGGGQRLTSIRLGSDDER